MMNLRCDLIDRPDQETLPATRCNPEREMMWCHPLSIFFIHISAPQHSAPDLPPDPGEPGPLACTPRPQGHKQQGGAQQQARMTPDGAKCFHAPVSQRQGR